MALATGGRLGSYEILAPLGKGGMGEVYKARDTRLDRVVAIKVLNAGFGAQPDARQRFEREARAISSLNHPHICTLHDIGEQDSIAFLVMEYLEGELLQSRLRSRSLPLDQAIRFGTQIADALAEAHGKGILHRDVKPANIMLTKNGVKLLDFGLAKLRASSPSPATAGPTLATLSLDETAKGTILGTLQYMSPEQLEGKEVDARTDIFALGVVLYEMAAGRRAFAGETQAALIANIMHADPPQISSAPPAFSHIVSTCLMKDRGRRWQSATDVKLQLEWAGTAGLSPSGADGRLPTRRWVLAGVGIGGAAAGIGGTLAALRAARQTQRVYRFALAPPPETEFLNTPNRLGLALSPDGTTLVFLAIRNNQSRLWVQRLNSETVHELPGTENATDPFWSPDGGSMGFFAEGALKRIDADGANLQVLCEVQAPRGAAWGSDGKILFSPANKLKTGLYAIPASGGKLVAITTVDLAAGETYHAYPVLFRGDRRFLYRANGTNGKIQAGSFNDAKWKAGVMPGNNWLEFAEPRPGGTRYAVWNRGETIVAQRWDQASLQLLGEAVPIGGPVGVLAPPATFTVSDSGLLIYAGPALLQLTWVDRGGRPLGVLSEPSHYGRPAVSPDGTKVAVRQVEMQVVIDLRTGVTSRIENASAYLVWSPDGRQLAFRRGGRTVVASADGSGPEIALPPAKNQIVTGWTADGRGLIYTEPGTDGRLSLWMAPLQSPGAARRLVSSIGGESHGTVSPDGRWLAFVGDSSGREEVYVQRMEGGVRTQVSSHGGKTPKWRSDGRELFYEALDGNLMCIAADPRPERIQFAAPRILFSLPAAYISGYSYDAAPDGQKFVIIAPYRPRAREPLTVVVNWPALMSKELGQRS